MAKKPKPYKPSAEEMALKAAQLEELRSKDSELNKSKYRAKKGAKSRRSLISHLPTEQVDTLGA